MRTANQQITPFVSAEEAMIATTLCRSRAANRHHDIVRCDAERRFISRTFTARPAAQRCRKPMSRRAICRPQDVATPDERPSRKAIDAICAIIKRRHRCALHATSLPGKDLTRGRNSGDYAMPAVRRGHAEADKSASPQFSPAAAAPKMLVRHATRYALPSFKQREALREATPHDAAYALPPPPVPSHLMRYVMLQNADKDAHASLPSLFIC